ncbi:MAG: hypothetical protein GWP70_07740 [Proteobacteria bacterium]|nr:hypothetical protein [Pseudomonadota bacterium]
MPKLEPPMGQALTPTRTSRSNAVSGSQHYIAGLGGETVLKRNQTASSRSARAGSNLPVSRHLGRPSPAVAKTVAANRAISAEAARTHASSEQMSAARDAVRARSTNLMEDIKEVGQRGVGPSELKTFSAVKDRQRQKQGVEALEHKLAQGSLSHDEKLQLSAASSKLRMRSEVGKLMSKDEAGKEEGFHRLTSAMYFQTKSAGEMGLTTAIHTTTREGAAEGIQKEILTQFSQESGRGAKGFYGAGDRDTSLKEIGHHAMQPHVELTHTIDPKAKVRDYTHPVDRTIVADRSADDAARDGRKNRGDLIKKDTLEAGAEFAAMPSMRSRGGVNTVKYTDGMSGYTDQKVTKTYTASERAQSGRGPGVLKGNETAASHHDAHQQQQRAARHALMAEIKNRA